jgi:4-aminobutyrate aminotransferase-like enzyme
MGNGFPIAAVISRPEILEAFCKRVGYFNTFAGSPVAAAVGQAVLDVIAEEGLMQNAAHVGAYLTQQFKDLVSHHRQIGEARGAGLYIGVDVMQPELARVILNGLRERRVLIGAAGRFGSVLKIRPPLCFTTAQADQLIAALDATLSDDCPAR